MASGTYKRPRDGRVTGFNLPPGQLARTLEHIRRGDVLLRLALCAGAALFLWLIAFGWAPPFAYRKGYIPPRQIVTRVKFERDDMAATAERNRTLRGEMLVVYENDPKPLAQLQQALKDKVFRLIRAEKFADVHRETWLEFYGGMMAEAGGTPEADAFQQFREALAMDMDLAHFEGAVKAAMQDIERHGLLTELHERGEGSVTAIYVHPVGDPAAMQRVEPKNVRIAEVAPVLEQRLFTQLRSSALPPDKVDVLGKLVFHWLKPRLVETLKIDEAATREAAEAIKQLPPVKQIFYPDETMLANAGEPLTTAKVELLREEYAARIAQLTLSQRLSYSVATLGMYAAIFTLCGAYLYHNHRHLLTSLRRFSTLLGLFVAAIVICFIADDWRAEVIPLLLFSMTVAIAYKRELALLLAACVAIIVTISAGYSLYEFIICFSAVAASVLFLGRIRSRTKLIYIGAATGAVAMLTALGVGTLAGQAFGTSGMAGDGPASGAEGFLFTAYPALLLAGATWFGFCGILAGLLMTGLLPFIERMFDIQTDISLLELGDVAHPLLQELVRRAPGTYNHSINVASIADAAAEAIGANGLLVRVGAYFHDIGKMLKPGYFVENQGQDQNRHESLLPAMSTLVIIAHVKDGAELARQHHLPQSIIDFIEQHHGTTLVEYFYRQAAKNNAANPDNSPVDESSFRYPGPKPQTKEAAVLMLADACESASRALVDPTPARLESLVHDIALKRLLDGQFEECGLSLQELHTVEDSLVKSLTAVYHGRVKYPSQATA
jgi:putative nucleotidyltransferase with HDIG domain